MAFAMSALLIIKDSGPITETHGVAGKFVEGLAEEFGTGPPKVNPLGFAALLGYWSDAEESHRL
jgi:hypothetical protein